MIFQLSCKRREELRNLREHVMLVVRDYNRIITELNQDEIGLFKERIKVLDKKVQPGLTKLTWAVNSFSDFYIGDCRVHASHSYQIFLFMKKLLMCEKSFIIMFLIT